MRPLIPEKTGSVVRRCATVFVATAMLTMGYGLVVAVDDSDSGEMTVSILPDVGTTPPPDEQPGGKPSLESPALATELQPHPFTHAGSVTAAIVASDGSGVGVLSMVTMAVRDDRGTAEGWTVTLSTEPDRSGWTPALMDNRRDTISLLLPQTDARIAQNSGVTSGQTLGPLLDPVPILLASPGSGAGVFSQRLGLGLPPVPTDAFVTMFVQVSFAP